MKYAILMAGGIGTVVYIDILIFTNTIINYLILLGSEKFLRIQLRNSRLILASFIGSLFSLLIFMDQRSVLFSLLIRIISTATLTLIAFHNNSVKELLLHAFTIFCVSLLFSGLMIFLYRVFHPPNLLIVNDIVYFEFNPLVMIVITVVIYLVLYVAERLYRPRLSSTVVPLSFTLDDHSYSCVGKIDTGCTLREPFSQAPVIIVDSSIVTVGEHTDRRVIPYSVLGSSSMLFGVPVQKLRISGREFDNTVYIATADLNDSTYQAIINSDIVR